MMMMIMILMIMIPVGTFIKYRLIVVDILDNDVNWYNRRERLGRSKVFGLHNEHKAPVFFFIDVVF